MLRVIFTATAIITSSSAIYIYIFHQRLSKRITHTSTSNQKPPNIKSIPDSIFTADYISIYDKCSKSAARSSLPPQPPSTLFTLLLRRNMTAFSHFPQALMLALVSKNPEQKNSFKKAHLSALDFDVGDLVCGVYRVVYRTRDRVEFEMQMQGLEFVGGRLVLSFCERGDEIVFCSETFMWRRKDEVRRMPLERRGIKWMHETAAWWLVDSGVKYLLDLE